VFENEKKLENTSSQVDASDLNSSFKPDVLPSKPHATTALLLATSLFGISDFNANGQALDDTPVLSRIASQNAHLITSKQTFWREELNKTKSRLISNNVSATYILDTIYSELVTVRTYCDALVSRQGQGELPYILRPDVLKNHDKSHPFKENELFLLANYTDGLVRMFTGITGADINQAVYDDLDEPSPRQRLLNLTRSSDASLAFAYVESAATQRFRTNAPLNFITNPVLDKKHQETLQDAAIRLQAFANNLHVEGERSINASETHITHQGAVSLKRQLYTLTSIIEGKLDWINPGRQPDEVSTVSSSTPNISERKNTIKPFP
jgi:hypothetical protein